MTIAMAKQESRARILTRLQFLLQRQVSSMSVSPEVITRITQSLTFDFAVAVGPFYFDRCRNKAPRCQHPEKHHQLSTDSCISLYTLCRWEQRMVSDRLQVDSIKRLASTLAWGQCGCALALNGVSTHHGVITHAVSVVGAETVITSRRRACGFSVYDC